MKVVWILLALVLLLAAYKWFQKTRSNAIDESSEEGSEGAKKESAPGSNAAKVVQMSS